ncbi:Acg family FMN-binding oxidoreductase [Nucisporomicrobium flavum]|uniref:Acg family FMN-binding oxidoreductase n=1 Tax=Nucisporomicrobium flavum TaxID=2785915 RepID=UPI003C2BEC5B
MATDISSEPVDTREEARALSDAATAAGYAPSILNSQPWRWRVTGDELNLHLDHSRGLEVTDPDSRLAILSCGAALHHALVSLAAAGWHTLVARLPDAENPDHLAQLRVDHRIPVEPAAIRHRQTIGLRHTDRRPALGAPVDAEKLRAIVAAVVSAGAGLHLLRPDQVYDLATAVDHAQRTEAGEDAWQAELRHWTGGTRPLGSGIPDAAIPRRTPQTTVPGRDFGHHGDLVVSDAHDPTAVFAILYGTQDTTLDWLLAGEALSAGWLTATELGVAVLPLSSTVEVTATRVLVRHLLADLDHPYLVLRLGMPDPADGPAPRTPRLPAGQIIERI